MLTKWAFKFGNIKDVRDRKVVNSVTKIIRPDLIGPALPHANRRVRELGIGPSDDFGNSFGLLPREKIQLMVHRKMIRASDDIAVSQYQPASLDLRLGKKAFRVRASFLPGKDQTVGDQLNRLKFDEISIDEGGAILEKGCVYVIPLQESLELTDSFSAVANPKSSTGRLDIFTRLISDRCEIFDQVARAYKGQLYAEVSPRSFSVRVKSGSKLNQIRFRRLHSNQLTKNNFTLSDADLEKTHGNAKLVDGTLNLREGLLLGVALSKDSLGEIVGFRAKKHTNAIDVDQVDACNVEDFWDPIRARHDNSLILDPGEFYILASKERLHIPPEFAAEMVAIDPSMGEFRVHYAGFFDPGFGYTSTGHPGSRAVLEVRSHEVPFILEDGQIIGRLVFEKMAEIPKILYGQTDTSNYQGQNLKLSKHFKMP